MPKSSQAFRTISEVAEDLDIQKHVLRFWEAKFAQLRPMKRGGGRRYYRPEDVELLRGIHHLLRSQAYTIKGVQLILREQGVEFVKGCWKRGGAAKLARGDAEAAGGVLRKRRGGAQAPVALEASSAGTAKGRKGASAPLSAPAAQLSAQSTKAVKGAIEQLESARQSLATTRLRATTAPEAKPEVKSPAKPESKAPAKSVEQSPKPRTKGVSKRA